MTQLITKIEIENLRGIARGELDGLAPLTILTGPNGCGKSTVLDALLIAASPSPGDAIGIAVKRHPAVRDGARWLTAKSAFVSITRAGIPSCHECVVDLIEPMPRQWRNVEIGPHGERTRRVVGYAVGHSTVQENQLARRGSTDVAPGRYLAARIAFTDSNECSAEIVNEDALPRFGDVRLVDPGLPAANLAVSYSNAVRVGAKSEIESYLSSVSVGATGLAVLAEEDGLPSLNIEYAGRPPVVASLGGDGVYAFLQLAIDLAPLANGLALVEEPEVYQHPRAIRQTARALVTAMRRGVQVVVTTHSLELIDAVLASVAEAELEKLAFYSLLLDDGVLKSTRYSGEDGAFARNEIDRDLR